jgi:hypothetical protein
MAKLMRSRISPAPAVGYEAVGRAEPNVRHRAADRTPRGRHIAVDAIGTRAWQPARCYVRPEKLRR